MAVLRNRVGLLEYRSFSTVLLGSRLVFVAMLFAAVWRADAERDLDCSFARSASGEKQTAVRHAEPRPTINTRTLGAELDGTSIEPGFLSTNGVTQSRRT